MKRSIGIVIATLLLLIGTAVMLYPKISNCVNTRNSSRAIQSLADELEAAKDEALLAQLALARAYNARLLSEDSSQELSSQYHQILSFANGMMGHIRIPAIDVELPIYHGTDADVLSKGVGHIPETAFPVGGTGSHCVLTGHTGLPSAELFSRLTELKVGDLFSVTVANRTLTYQVDQIRVVSPSDISELLPVPGKDLCTLATCTPYGVNSHRLLVRGSRVN